MRTKKNTTEVAFVKLLNRPDQWRRTGRPMNQRLVYLAKFAAGKPFSEELMDKILKKAGASVKQEKIWNELI